ncbi:MAG: family 20 glycosylhydrolase, partial [Bacteroidota bacterium]
MTEELIMLPNPRRLRRLEGNLALRPEGFIFLGRRPSPGVQSAARLVQDALRPTGARWELTAARGGDPGMLRAILAVDPARVPREEGYSLYLGPDGIRLTGHDEAGVFYGAVTLRQILRGVAPGGAIPALQIEDWPDYRYRGVMLDISRDKVPSLDTLLGLVDLLAELKLNQFQLYTEHTYAYRNHREVWQEASPLTGEEILLLDAYCRERHIELVPNQNSFGHLSRWLKHPRYRHLAEAPDGFTFPWGARSGGPFSLCPLEPGALTFLAELYDELLPHFSSGQFNVGCDETFDLGRGRSAEACRERGVGRVYLEFLLKVHRLVAERGRTMQFWGDIIGQHPELIPELPRETIALAWGYEADHPFAAEGERFAAAGIPFYVCPGTSSWNSIAGRTSNALGNLLNAAEQGLAHGAIGYLNTDWGDNGHWQPLPVSYLGYAYGAAVSWCLPANREIDLPRALDRHVFLDRGGIMGQAAFDLGEAYRVSGMLLPNSSILHGLLLDPEHPLVHERFGALTAESLA